MTEALASSEAQLGLPAAGAAGAAPRWLPDWASAALAHAVFALLAVVAVVRVWHHPMWRDEFETYWIAVSSSSFSDLLFNMKYTAHPALLYILVWLGTRVTANPVAMQIVQIALALGVWVVVYVWSPFSRLEKVLLLLSYFLFWEYFVFSRNYVHIALIAFVFIALRERQRRPEFVLWLLLGLLANVHAYATIWSLVLASLLAIEQVRRRSVPAYVPLAGAAAYLALLAFAIVMMRPPPHFALSAPGIEFSFSRFSDELSTPFGAFVPVSFAELRTAMAWIAHPQTAAVPDFFNASPASEFAVLTQADTLRPIWLALVFAAPVVACWLLTRSWLLVVEFTLVYLGILMFENIWHFPGSARHHGVVFLALVAAVWSARSRQAPTARSPWLFAAILFVNACSGVMSLASELRPFSESYETATWIRQNNLDGSFLIGSHDAQVSAVIGYLQRPVYYLECECFRPFGVWDATRQDRFSKQPFADLLSSKQQFAERLAKAIAVAGQRDAVLIRNRPVTADDLKFEPRLVATFLKSFTNASTGENFWIYRMSAQP